MHNDSVARAPADHATIDHSSVERELAWDTGSVFFKAKRSAELRCENKFRRHDFAIGFAFQGLDSEMNWYIDGKHLLSKEQSSQRVCRDMVILPVGSEFHGISHGPGECLWLFYDSALAKAQSDNTSFTDYPLVTSTWAHDRLSWMLIAAIKEECRSGFARGSMCVESFALSVFSQLTHKFTRTRTNPPTVQALSTSDVRMLTEFIDANLHRNIALSELSQLVDLSPSHLCRAFKQAAGRPPHQFQIERRIDKAKALLQRPDLSLVEVALELGFSTQSHLSNQFRRIVGMTPARFRVEYASHQFGAPPQLEPAFAAIGGDGGAHEAAQSL